MSMRSILGSVARKIITSFIVVVYINVVLHCMLFILNKQENLQNFVIN